MAQRPSDFNTTTPTGSDSPRQADDELRKIKQYTQNAYNDLTQSSGANVVHSVLYGTTITASTAFDGNLVGNVEGDVTGDLEGNASTATTLETARDFSCTGDVTATAVSFNGSADVELDVTLNDDSVNSDVIAENGVATANIADGAVTNAKIDSVDASKLTGTISDDRYADTIAADISGNAATATKLATARTISLTGGASGSGSFDGSGNLSINVALQTEVADAQNFTGGAEFSAGTVSVDSDVTWTFDTDTTLTLPNNCVSADQLDVSGDGTSGQILTSDGDGSMSWTTASSANNSSIGFNSAGDVTANSGFTLNQAANETITLSIGANKVGSDEIAANAVGASELNVSGNGTSTQFLRSDGDGSFTWATPTDTNTTYSASSTGGLSLSGTAFSIKTGGVTAAHIATNAVGSAEIAANAVGSSELADSAVNEVLEAAYPIGSIYINAGVSTNPGTLLGIGTWEAFGSGRVIVGVNTSDADFNAIRETGGSKTDTIASHTHTGPSHTHSIPNHTHSFNASGGSFRPDPGNAGDGDPAYNYATTSGTTGSGGGGTTGAGGTGNTGSAGGATVDVVQPYITAYMWRRTA